MLFNSFEFWIFFVVVLVGFYSLPNRFGSRTGSRPLRNRASMCYKGCPTAPNLSGIEHRQLGSPTVNVSGSVR